MAEARPRARERADAVRTVINTFEFSCNRVVVSCCQLRLQRPLLLCHRARVLPTGRVRTATARCLARAATGLSVASAARRHEYIRLRYAPRQARRWRLGTGGSGAPPCADFREVEVQHVDSGPGHQKISLAHVHPLSSSRRRVKGAWPYTSHRVRLSEWAAPPKRPPHTLPTKPHSSAA